MLASYQKFYIMKAYQKIKSTLILALTFPLILLSCKKEASISSVNVKQDSTKSLEKPIDSLTPILNTMRESNQIVISVNASKLPIKLIQDIKNPKDQIVLKLENYNQPNLKAYIKPDKPMNIRINQIRMPDNTFDGPFGLNIDYKTKQKGEYWLILAKDNMASGEPTGRFFIKVE